MTYLIIAAIAWIAIWVFNVREFVIRYLAEFSEVTRADMAFFITMGFLGPLSASLPLWWLIKRKTNFRVDWDKAVFTKDRRK